MAVEGGTVVRAFDAVGWGWGGRWSGDQGLPALLRERPVIGALALVAGAALLATGSLRLSAAARARSAAAFLLGAYVIAWAQLVVVLWALSLFGWVTRWGLLAGLALVCVALLVDTRGWSDVRVRLADGVGGSARGARRSGLRASWRRRRCRARLRGRARAGDAAERLRHARRPPVARRALDAEPARSGYPECACAPYVNAYPPHGGDGRAGDDGARRLRPLRRARPGVRVSSRSRSASSASRAASGSVAREALLGALLVATLPVIALQASTAQNDLVVASFLVAAVVLLLATRERARRGSRRPRPRSRSGRS